jgi:hypothetical protein
LCVCRTFTRLGLSRSIWTGHTRISSPLTTLCRVRRASAASVCSHLPILFFRASEFMEAFHSETAHSKCVCLHCNDVVLTPIPIPFLSKIPSGGVFADRASTLKYRNASPACRRDKKIRSYQNLKSQRVEKTANIKQLRGLSP